jgi:hypothetical protein
VRKTVEHTLQATQDGRVGLAFGQVVPIASILDTKISFAVADRRLGEIISLVIEDQSDPAWFKKAGLAVGSVPLG